MSCLCCCDDITVENRVGYTHLNSHEELESAYCWVCVKHLLDTRFQDYVDTIYKETCKKTLRTMIERGPPLYFSDQGLPVPEGSRMSKLIIPSEDGQTLSIDAVYTGAPTGAEREELWNDLRAAVIQRMELLPNPNDSEEEEAM